MKLCKLSTQPLEQNICMAIPIGDTMICRKYVESCPVVMEGRTLLAKLAVFGIPNFDIIIGIDWLAKYEASINCRKK